MTERVQEERRWTPADRLEMKLDQALAERDRLAGALGRIVALQRRWDAPVETDDYERSNEAWSAVGSEAHKIAYEALKEEAKAQAPKPHEQ